MMRKDSPLGSSYLLKCWIISCFVLFCFLRVFQKSSFDGFMQHVYLSCVLACFFYLFSLYACVCQDFRSGKKERKRKRKRERNRDVIGFGCRMKYGVDVNSIQMYSFNQTWGLRRGRPFAPT